MGSERQKALKVNREINFAFNQDGIGRFRANAYFEKGSLALVIRLIQGEIQSLEELDLPAEPLKQIMEASHGLLLITGRTGSGKSTTAASVLEHLNQTKACHIVTLEDPIEFLLKEKKAVVSQREVGLDTLSFEEGLKSIFRQSADVLFISDIYDQRVMEIVLLAAESGQMVVSCLHAANVINALERVIAFFPEHQQPAVQFRLSLALRGIVSQRLLPRQGGSGLIPACEVMVATPTMTKLLREGRLVEMPPLMEEGGIQGMQTLCQALYQRVHRRQVEAEAALKVADSPEELELALREIRATKDVRSPR